MFGKGAPALLPALQPVIGHHLVCLEVPRIETGHGETLSPLNPMGVKGAGEAGAIPVGPLFAQALEDALWDREFEVLEIPLNSNRLWELVNKRD